MPQYLCYESCSICPRECGAKRQEGKTGVCKVTDRLRVARAALHFWEEPCISGSNGSGAVFFSGCSLHCVFCQNESIAQGITGKDIPPERLAEIFLELQEKGANNINLVTPTHYVPHIIRTVEDARRQGLKLPIVYNTGSYEKVDTLKSLEGIVDVYLPDFKYFSSGLAKRYSHAADYPMRAKEAIAEMVRQQPKAAFYPERGSGLKSITEARQQGNFITEAEDGYLMSRGVIVRQLLLPGFLKDAEHIIRYLHQTYGNRIYVSMMSQFTPLPHVEKYPELNRKVTEEEYREYIEYAFTLGVENGFLQEGDVAEDSFIPAFDCEGVWPVEEV